MDETLSERAERLASLLEERIRDMTAWGQPPSDWPPAIVNTLRALAAENAVLRGERDSILQEAMEETATLKAERDAALAHVRRLEEAGKALFDTPINKGKYVITSDVVLVNISAALAFQAALADTAPAGGEGGA